MQDRGIMYKEVPETVLLYGSKSWVVTEAMLKIMDGFHHLVARRIARMTLKRVAYLVWEYSMVVAVVEAVGLHLIQYYMCRR